MTDTRATAIGILLSAIMVLSVFAMPATAQANLNLSGSDGTITQGTSTVTVSFVLENTGTESTNDSTVEITNLPDEWAINNVQTDGGTTSSNNTQVLYSSVGTDSTVNPTWTLSVPETVTTGEYTITGNLIQDGSITQSVDITIDVESTDTDDRFEGDAKLDTDATFWQGQELYFNASKVVSDDATAQKRTFQVRQVTGDNNDNVGNLVDEFTVDEDTLEATINTDDLDGFYVLTYPSEGQIVEISDGHISLGGSTANVDAEKFDWEVAPQTLSAKFDDDDNPVLQDESATLEITSNRGSGYIVNISAENLDQADQEEIWGQEQKIVYVDNDDDLIGVEVDSDEELEANFSIFDEPGQYTFELAVADSTATGSANITVNERDVDIEFTQNGVFSQQVGDVAAITVELGDTDTGYIFIGGTDTNFFERIKIIDDNDDGEVVLEMDTFNAHKPGVDTYETGDDDDSVESVTEFSSADFASELNYPIDTQPLIGPLEPGSYNLFAAATEDVEVTDDGAITIEDETDVGTLELTRRKTKSIQTWVAPSGSANAYEDADDLLAGNGTDDESDTVVPTQANTVAFSDRLIVQVEASGLYAYLEDDQIPSQAGIGENGLDLTIEETEESVPANAEAAQIDLSASHTHLYTDADNEQFFVVVNMRNLDADRIDDGDTLHATFSIYGPAEDTDPLGEIGDEAPDGYDGGPNPYVNEDDLQEVRTEFSVEDADADFDDLVNVDGGDNELHVRSESGVEISGTTNVAPGTDLTIQVRATGDTPFFRTQDVTVTEVGSFSGRFNFSTVPVGADFTVEISQSGTTLSKVDGRVVEQIGTPTPTPQETPLSIETVIVTQSPPPSPTPQEVTVVRTEVVTRTVVKTRSETPGQPGFGVMIALVALLAATAAALLALNRRG